MPAVEDAVVSGENVQRLLEHLLAKEKRESGFSSLLLRKAILQYLELPVDGGYDKNCARRKQCLSESSLLYGIFAQARPSVGSSVSGWAQGTPLQKL